jgi:glycosyltransferase involved in cell wall biosynthesis
MEIQMARVDIAVPCYNYGRFLGDCAGSILSQSHKDLRLLIIDNASTDDSLAVARAIAAGDDRVEILAHPKNLGPHASYNAGVDWASGDYFLLLDADDLLTPGSLERSVAIMEANPDITFVHGRELCLPLAPGEQPAFDPEPASPGWEIIGGHEYILRRCRDPQNTIGSPTVLRRVSAQKQIGHYRASLPYTDDFEMWLRLATLGRAAETTAAQGIRRLHGAQATEAYREVPARDFIQHMAAFDSFFANEGASLPDAGKLHRFVRRTIAVNALWYGLWRRREGDARNAELCIQYGLSLNAAATAPRLIKRLLVGEIGMSEARGYLAALITGRASGQLAAH